MFLSCRIDIIEVRKLLKSIKYRVSEKSWGVLEKQMRSIVKLSTVLSLSAMTLLVCASGVLANTLSEVEINSLGDGYGIVLKTDEAAQKPQPQNNGNTFIINDEQPAAMPEQPETETPGKTVIETDSSDEHAPAAGNNGTAGSTTIPVQPAREEPAAGQNTAGQPANENVRPQDEFIIEFNDDSGNVETPTDNNTKNNRRQESFDLEDEYYDLEGF